MIVRSGWRAVLGVMAMMITVSGAGSASASDPAGDMTVIEARFAGLKGGLVDNYDPLEPMYGVPKLQPLPMARKPRISQAARDSAKAYAIANRSKALLVWRDGALEQADYFGGATAQTPLVSKSLSKPLTAIVIGRAMALGYIKSLDQPMTDFIPEWKGTPKATIKLRYLLDMRSGLMPQGPAPTADHILNRVYLSPHHQDVMINDYPLLHEPGARYDYGNAIADLVAVVVERATGQRFTRFVSQQVFKPIGARGGQAWVDRPGGLAHSACCMMIPAETWLRLGILVMDDGRWQGRRLLPVGYVTQMRTGTPQNPYYGLGVYVSTPWVERRGFGNRDLPGPLVLHSEPYQASDLFLFDGNANQVVYIVPSERLVILRMGDPPPKSPEWDNSALPNMLLRGMAKRASGWTPQPRP